MISPFSPPPRPRRTRLQPLVAAADPAIRSFAGPRRSQHRGRSVKHSGGAVGRSAGPSPAAARANPPVVKHTRQFVAFLRSSAGSVRRNSTLEGGRDPAHAQDPLRRGTYATPRQGGVQKGIESAKQNKTVHFRRNGGPLSATQRQMTWPQPGERIDPHRADEVRRPYPQIIMYFNETDPQETAASVGWLSSAGD
jgi:hypothetical protein